MGMAASQSRYLALTARKTNCEYEGQQINQARTALANQSANLFNRLLDLKVPVAPKTTDYTEVQYSFSDGTNESVIDSWQQLGTNDPNYNYIVNHYYYANIYTGSEKLMSDPQVQTKGKVSINDFKNQEPEVSYDPINNTYTITTKDGNSQTYSSLKNRTMDKKLENSLRDFEVAKGLAKADGILTTDAVYGYQDTNGTWHFFLENEIAEPKDYSTTYKPSFIGNMELTELNDLTTDQKAELTQILKDFPNSNMNKYLSFDKNNELNYKMEGMYTFEKDGITYYVNDADLHNSMQTYNQYGKPTEIQNKLPYYNSQYVKTRIEDKNQALVEKDENGRFKSVKFKDDSIVYSLNTETVTNDKAYQDALNEYHYKVQEYEKTIADINAKTSIIQQEDRTLELRLKQLDTEQNALATEMDAVKKVIKDNVEKTFKTFSD